MSRHAAILLAAGGSSRLGFPKQLLLKNSVPLVRQMAQLLLDTNPARVIVVTGGASEDVMAALHELPVECAFNPEWRTGLASSVQSGIRELQGTRFEAALITATDQPFLTLSHLQQLVESRPENGDIISGYGVGKGGGIPVCLSRRTTARLSELDEDAGFRKLWNAHERPERIENPDLLYDIDTVGNLNLAIDRSVMDAIQPITSFNHA